MVQFLGISWPVNPTLGWGVYGTNLARYLHQSADWMPVLMVPPAASRQWLTPLLQRQQQDFPQFPTNSLATASANFPVLHSLGNQLVGNAPPLLGTHRFGIIFFENTQLSQEAIARSQAYDLIVAGSSWNAQILRSRGCQHVTTAFQGIDSSLFYPAAKTHRFGDRFVIFSGGKLEYRKGQDIVIAAFREFQKNHPDALLVVAWHNHWPEFIKEIACSPHVEGIPQIDAKGRLQITEWLVANGIPAESVCDVGLVPHESLPEILREADVAAFPNRAEGGTNLVAMEAMACGVPTVLSANTGHLDIIGDSHCYILQEQGPVRPTPQFPGVEGWGESQVEELVDVYRRIYRDRETAKEKGDRAAQFMANWHWEQQIPQLLAAIEPYLQTSPMTSPAPPAASEPLRSVHTSNLSQILQQLGISLVVSTYQAGKVIAIRADGDTVNTHFRIFNKPMGLAADQEKMAVGCAHQIWELRNVAAVAPKIEPTGKHDACYLPRRSHVTGDIDIHEMAYIGDELWFVNTRFSCLCTCDFHHSFVPRWRPPFVSGYSLGDRCHLNGLAVRDNQPRYVTALAETDTDGGWREHKAFGGILMDVQENRILCRGLSMPHSPRWYRGRLWVLESGKGTLAVVDPQAGTWQTVAKFGGFTRGIDFCGDLAFIGLSQVRESAVFSGIPLVEELPERICGVWVVNIQTGETVAFLRFEEAVQEIFSVQVLPEVRFPEIIDWDENLLASSYVLPDEALQEVVQPQVSDADSKDKAQQALEAGNREYYAGNLENAIAHYRRCLELDPDLRVAQYNLGVVLGDCDRSEEAIEQLREFLKKEPDNAAAYQSLGYVFANLKDFSEAVACLQKAIALQPDYAQAHFNLGMILLRMGELARGFAESEWRWQTPEFTPFESPHPIWDGRELPNATLLLHTEQGAGDAIQFARYIPLVAPKFQKVILVCTAELMPLLQTVDGVDQIMLPGKISVSDFDTYAPLMSLPHILGTTLATVPANVPYVRVPQNKTGFQLPKPRHSQAKIKVGMVWAGSPTHKNDRNRSCQLSHFLPWLKTPHVAFYSLQKGEREWDLQSLPSNVVVEDLAPLLQDYGDTAAAIFQLDLVIGVDTSVVHLAGALGKPVWTLLSDRADWRWMLEREDSPWYPTMRLFRQPSLGDWQSVSERVAEALVAFRDGQ